ncbi:MAG: hypothetical protein K0S23_536 [Fluviicola sp.]|jgi:hypothetical protein|nr:hypothetical protein [Fluviicola sp.]
MYKTFVFFVVKNLRDLREIKKSMSIKVIKAVIGS